MCLTWETGALTRYTLTPTKDNVLKALQHTLLYTVTPKAPRSELTADWIKTVLVKNALPDKYNVGIPNRRFQRDKSFP